MRICLIKAFWQGVSCEDIGRKFYGKRRVVRKHRVKGLWQWASSEDILDESSVARSKL